MRERERADADVWCVPPTGATPLQLHRSVCRGPYSQFSTGNITTLRDTPAEQGIHVASLLRQFWIRHYTAGAAPG